MIMRSNNLAPLSGLIAVLFLASGCARAPAPSVKPALPVSKGDQPRIKTYKLVGKVREVNRESGIVSIRHEEIAGFMKAMTMPFSLKGEDVLDDLRPGDEVEGTLRVEMETSPTGEEIVKDYHLQNLEVTVPAPPPSLTLNLSSGAARIETRPKVLEVGDPVPDFTMTTQDGKTLALADLRGKVVVITFIYTRCPLPDFCPLIDRKFSELADRVSATQKRAERVRLLSISFDPEHDTPEVLRKHARLQGGRPPLWTFAVASHAELAKIAPALGLTYGPTANEIIHNLSMAVVAPDGTLARLETGAAVKAWKSSDLLKTIDLLIPLAGK